MRSFLNVVLLILVVGTFGLNWALRRQPNERNLEAIPQMVDAVPFDAYTENPNFPDGKTLQPPPAHAVVRGLPPLHYAATPEDARRAGEELTSSFSATDAVALARGAAVYATFCQVCHGPQGKGDGPVAQRGFPAPPSLLAPNALAMRDGQLFHVITYGQNVMPGYAAQIAREDRWQAVLHVRRLQEAASSAASGATPAEPETALPAPQTASLAALRPTDSASELLAPQSGVPAVPR